MAQEKSNAVVPAQMRLAVCRRQLSFLLEQRVYLLNASHPIIIHNPPILRRRESDCSRRMAAHSGCMLHRHHEESCAARRHKMPRPHVTLTFDLLTLKVVSESRATRATYVPI